MKKSVKKALHAVGLLAPVQQIYFNARTLTPSIALHELKLSTHGAPDGYPLPPPRMVFDVIACRWRAVYQVSGQLIADDLASILSEAGHPLRSFSHILDFGCGCGRLTRQLPSRTDAQIAGSDLNPELSGWCADNLPFGRFCTNDLLPPLEFGPRVFDLIIARSVFTHLPEPEQLAWMREFERVLAPGGLIYLTMHGEQLASGLTPSQRQILENDELVVTYAALAGDNICSTWASRGYVERRLLEGFELLKHVPGRSATHLRQDVYVLQRS